jgi:putative membrane protein
MQAHDRGQWFPIALMAGAAAATALSGIGPFDRMTWWLEVAPVLIGLVALAATWRRCRLTNLLYGLLFLHAVLLVVGGHYTYARVPIGFSVQELLDLSRNPYDRFGHFAQGFVPAILVREIFLRFSPLSRGGWLFVVVTSVCLAFSALFELFEWLVAAVAGDGSTDYLALQGDPWDTQWDMFYALIGAMTAQWLLGRWHDRQIARLGAQGIGP